MSTSANLTRERLIPERTEGIALVLFTACTWGLTWPQTKYLMSLLPPFTARASCGIAGAGFAFAVALLRRETILPPRDQWGRLFVFAMLNYGAFILLTTKALETLKASEAVTITYTLPIWASLLAWPMLHERMTVRKVFALVLALAGVALLVKADTAAATLEKLPAAGMALVAALLFGLGTVIAKKYPLRMPPTSAVAWQAGLGVLPVAALAVFETPDWGRMTDWGWAAITYVSIVPMTIAYLAWFRALRMVPASLAATTVLVSPVVGVIGSGLLLGETFAPGQVAGLVMTLLGVALAAMG